MILQLDTENADRNLTALVTVLTHTPSATEPIWCKGLVMFGDGTKNLSATGGDFELTITVGGNTVQPDPQTIAFSTAVRAAVWTTEFPVPANAEVVLKAKSPNAGDSDVDVTAYLYQIDKVDVLAIGGDKQSATDLKDFADSGYDPATSKVEGVKLTDTTTTNTDMVAAAPTAAQNRAEMDSNSTKLAAIAVDVAGLDGEAMRGTDGAVTSVAGLATEANVDAVGLDVMTRAAPGDAMSLTAPTITAIDTELSATHGAGSWESAGVAAGANIVVITINDTLGFPVPSTSVVVRNNADNATIGFYVTNNNGQITANLDNSPAGQPYKIRLGKVGVMFTIPENLTVLGDTNQTYTGTVVDPGVPVAGLQTLSGNIKLLTGEAEPNATVRAVIASMPQHVDLSVLSNVVSEAETDSNGNFSLYLIKGASVTLFISQDVNGRRFWQKTITVTDDNNRNIVEY